MTDKAGNVVAITDITLDKASNKVIIEGDFSSDGLYTVSYNGDQYQAQQSWQYTDSKMLTMVI